MLQARCPVCITKEFLVQVCHLHERFLTFLLRVQGCSLLLLHSYGPVCNSRDEKGALRFLASLSDDATLTRQSGREG